MVIGAQQQESLINKLSNDPRKEDQHVNVTPNLVCTSTHPKWQGTKQTMTEHKFCTNRGHTDLRSRLSDYNTNQLRANPTKTQTSLFHLRNRESGKQLNISWNAVKLTTATSRCSLASHSTERCHIKHISRRQKRKSEQETSSANKGLQNREPLQPHSGRPL